MESIINSSSLRICSPNWCHQSVWGEQRPDHFLSSVLRTYLGSTFLYIREYLKKRSSYMFLCFPLRYPLSQEQNSKPLPEEVIANSLFTDRNVDESLRGYFTKVSSQNLGVLFLCLEISRISIPKTHRGIQLAGPILTPR